MSYPLHRRRLLLTGAAALVAGAGAARAGAFRGTVTFAGGGVIPKGQLVITVEAPGRRAPKVTETRIASDGKSTEIGFTLPAEAVPSRSGQIVARLERSDGWLLARGSAALRARTPVTIELFEAMY